MNLNKNDIRLFWDYNSQNLIMDFKIGIRKKVVPVLFPYNQNEWTQCYFCNELVNRAQCFYLNKENIKANFWVIAPISKEDENSISNCRISHISCSAQNYGHLEIEIKK